MKCLVVFFTVCVFAVLADQASDQKLQAECAAEHKLELNVIEDVIKNSKWNSDPKVDCFFFCYMKKLGQINDEGVLDLEKTRAGFLEDKIEPEKLDKLINKCKDIKGSTPCSTAAKLFECYYKEKEFKAPGDIV